MPILTQKHGTLEYLVAEGIGVPHGFTTRLGGVSTEHLGTLNLGMHRGDTPENVAKNYEILANALDFDLQNLVLTQQTHSDTIRAVSRADAAGIDHRAYPACDGLITNDPGTVLTVFTADCTPILLWDSISGAVGAVHAGWRGTAADIAGKAVAAMVETYGCDPKNIHAAIGPNIGPCCFQTHREVPDAMMETFGDAVKNAIRPSGEKYYVNLKEINAHALYRRGVTHVETSRECTMCQHHRFWSHRYTGGARGSQGALIVCKEVNT